MMVDYSKWKNIEVRDRKGGNVRVLQLFFTYCAVRMCSMSQWGLQCIACSSWGRVRVVPCWAVIFYLFVKNRFSQLLFNMPSFNQNTLMCTGSKWDGPVTWAVQNFIYCCQNCCSTVLGFASCAPDTFVQRDWTAYSFTYQPGLSPLIHQLLAPSSYPSLIPNWVPQSEFLDGLARQVVYTQPY